MLQTSQEAWSFVDWLISILNFEQFSAVSSFQDKFFEQDLQ